LLFVFGFLHFALSFLGGVFPPPVFSALHGEAGGGGRRDFWKTKRNDGTATAQYGTTQHSTARPSTARHLPSCSRMQSLRFERLDMFVSAERDRSSRAPSHDGAGA